MAFATLPDGASLYYEEYGAEKPALLLCTGLGGLASFWHGYVGDLARDFHVVCYDHRGTGASTLSEPPYSVDDMAADALRLMDHLGIERFHVCGHSTGGAIGQLLAARHPHRVASLLLAATWGRPDPYFSRCFDCRLPLLDTVGPAAYYAATSLLIYPPSWISGNYDRLLTIEAANAAALVRPDILKARIAAICAFDASAEHARIKAPTLIVAARDDMTTIPAFAEALHASISGARLHMLDRGAHLFPLTASDAFAPILHEWLASQPRIPATSSKGHPTQ